MWYWYCILLHAWPILLLNIPLCNIHIAFCYVNVTFGYMSFVNLILYEAMLISYFVNSCIMRHCIMWYESSIRRDVFCSVVFRFMNELIRHLVYKFLSLALDPNKIQTSINHRWSGRADYCTTEFECAWCINNVRGLNKKIKPVAQSYLLYHLIVYLHFSKKMYY